MDEGEGNDDSFALNRKEAPASTDWRTTPTPLSSAEVETWLSTLLDVAESARGNPVPVLGFLREEGNPPLPGHGVTATLWSYLSEVAAVDLAAARTLEPHLDAAAMLDQANMEFPGGAWGVFAAESPRAGVEATREPDGTYWLSGIKAWCSLAGEVDHAIITARVSDGRQAFAVNLRTAGVHTEDGIWVSRGLA